MVLKTSKCKLCGKEFQWVQWFGGNVSDICYGGHKSPPEYYI